MNNLNEQYQANPSDSMLRPLDDAEVDSVGGGVALIALIYIYNSAQNSTGGNSDISSWAAA
jgi:hypothetical protein